MPIVDPHSGPTDLDTLAYAAENISETQTLKSFGLPDPAFLTRLANNIFSALPNQSFPNITQDSISKLGLSPQNVISKEDAEKLFIQERQLPAADPLDNNIEPLSFIELTKDGLFLESISDLSKGHPSSQEKENFKILETPPDGSTDQLYFLEELPIQKSSSNLKISEHNANDVIVAHLNEVIGSSNYLVPKDFDKLAEDFEDNRQIESLSLDVQNLKKNENEIKNLNHSLNHAMLQTGVHESRSSSPLPQVPAAINAVPPVLNLKDPSEFLSHLGYLKEKDLLNPNKHGSLYFLNQAPLSSFEKSQEKVSTQNAFDLGGFSSSHPAFDVISVRKDFPALKETINGRQLIWFDNAATTQKPSAVIERLKYFYEHENSNIHRAAHELAARATDAYEEARSKVAKFIGANSKSEIIFTRGATEAINLVAATLGQVHIHKDDEILITHLEHHANIVPWQQLAFLKGAKLKIAPVDENGVLLLEEFGRLLTNKTKLVSFTHVSNALGTITPAKTLIEMAHRVGACVLIDGAQSVSHMKVNVQEIDADFFVFSGHKLFGPTGIGVLYGKKQILDRLPPYQMGGNMIKDVTFERTLFNSTPERFEAGTGNIADAVGLGAAIDYVERIGLDNIARYEHALLMYGTKKLCEIPNLKIIGKSPEKASLISFVIDGISSEQIGVKLNSYGIAVRAGHHCAQPILRRYNLESTVRPSFAFYNTFQEIDELVSALKNISAETGHIPL